MEENIATACGTIKIDFTIKLSRIVLYILKNEYVYKLSEGALQG